MPPSTLLEFPLPSFPFFASGVAACPFARSRSFSFPPAIALSGVAGALTAGLFLQEFVPDGAAWAHLDIAGPFLVEKPWKYYEAGAVGFGLKTLVDLAERFHDYF